MRQKGGAIAPFFFKPGEDIKRRSNAFLGVIIEFKSMDPPLP
jgi:hypothetical protein